MLNGYVADILHLTMCVRHNAQETIHYKVLMVLTRKKQIIKKDWYYNLMSMYKRIKETLITHLAMFNSISVPLKTLMSPCDLNTFLSTES